MRDNPRSLGWRAKAVTGAGSITRSLLSDVASHAGASVKDFSKDLCLSNNEPVVAKEIVPTMAAR